MTERNLQIDAVRGWAIILVILGHVTYFSDPANVSQNLMFNIIYSFHMPLFFFISGYVIYNHFSNNLISWTAKKFTGLILPYVTYTLVYFFMLPAILTGTIVIGTLPEKLFSYLVPDSAWFLPVLFELLILTAVLICLEKWLGNTGKYLFPLTIVVLVFILPLTDFAGMTGLSQIIHYLPYVLTGYYVNNYGTRLIKPGYPLKYLIGSLCVFTSLFVVKTAYVNLLNFSYATYLLSVALAFSGIISSIFLVSVLSMSLVKWLTIPGIFSLELYLSHILILNYGIYCRILPLFGPGVVEIIMSTAVVTLISLLASLALSYNKTISTIFFGRWSFKIFLRNYNAFKQNEHEAAVKMTPR